SVAVYSDLDRSRTSPYSTIDVLEFSGCYLYELVSLRLAIGFPAVWHRLMNGSCLYKITLSHFRKKLDVVRPVIGFPAFWPRLMNGSYLDELTVSPFRKRSRLNQM